METGQSLAQTEFVGLQRSPLLARVRFDITKPSPSRRTTSHHPRLEPTDKMAFGNQFHMPGSYHFEGPGASSTALNANMFRPPVSPSSSTYNLAKSTGSLLSDNSMTTSNAPAPRLGRKRTHDESLARGGYSREFGCDSPMEDSARGQHRYTLAGQIETPGAQVTPGEGMLEDSLYSDVDYRRALGPKRPPEGDSADTTHPSVGLTNLVNAELGEPVTPRTAGWTTFAFQTIGGVVGKVWEFCRGGAGAFRGFQAGGGKGYEFNGQPIPTLAPARHDGPRSAGFSQETPNSPPGAYPGNDDVVYYSSPVVNQVQTIHQEPEPDTTPERPAAKRRQTGLQYENDELRRNWVMVDDDEPSTTPCLDAKCASVTASTASSRIPAANRSHVTSRLQQPRVSTPGRKISVPSPRFSADRSNHSTRASSRLHMPPVASCAGHAGSPSLNAREPASFASPRSPAESEPISSFPSTPTGSRIPQPKSIGPNPFATIRTASPSQTRPSPSRPSSRQSLHASALAPTTGSRIATPSGHRKSASTTSVGSVRGRHSIGLDDKSKVPKPQASPRLDDEGRHLATKRYAAERRADSRLDRLNAELQGLIRQGQEALGTTYDVDMDEGWEEA